MSEVLCGLGTALWTPISSVVLVFFNHSLSMLNLSLIGAFYVTHVTRALQNYDLSGEGIDFVSHTHFFDHTRTWRMSDQINAGATSETTRALKTIHTIHSNKADMMKMIMMAK